MEKIGIPRALLYYYYMDKWKYFFEYLNYKVILSPPTNKELLENGEALAIDETCLALKLYLGHVNYLKTRCDYILVPRLFSVQKYEQVCTNFNCLYDLVNNLFDDIHILNYNVDTYKKKSELLGFIKMGEKLGVSYISSYNAYKYAVEQSKKKRKEKELLQAKKLNNKGIKILLAGHPYNLYDDLIGMSIIKYLKEQNITILYSDRIHTDLIHSECRKISTDIHWTHSKEVMASIHYYQDKVDGIILLSSFPCGPDSLANELIRRKIKDTPILSLVFENMNSDVGVTTRLESFFDILKERRTLYEKSN